MNDFDNSDLELILPSPVRGYNQSSLLLDKTKKRKRYQSSSADAQTRAKMFQNSNFSAEKAQLFCRYCSVGTDHSRQSDLNAHLQSDTPKKHKSTPMEKKQVQGTLFTTFPVPNEARLDNLTLITDWVRACAGSKISLNAASSSLMRNFLLKHVPYVGSIPPRNGLSRYLTDCFISDKDKMKAHFKGKKIMIFYDETIDSDARNVCVIAMATVPPTEPDIKPFLAEIVFQDKPLDRSLVVEHFLECLSDNSIRLRDVVAYETHNVGYMLTSYKNSLKLNLRNCVHLSCVCHILNLVIKDFTQEFFLCAAWAKKFPAYFCHSGVRRRRYLTFLHQSGYKKQLAPNPIETRWTSSFETMTYYAEFLPVEKAFLATETIDLIDSDTLEDLRQFLSSNFKSILLECKFVSERMKPLIDTLKVFESNMGLTALMQGLIDHVVFQLDSQVRFHEDSVSEVLISMTETFSKAETENFKQ